MGQPNTTKNSGFLIIYNNWFLFLVDLDSGLNIIFLISTKQLSDTQKKVTSQKPLSDNKNQKKIKKRNREIDAHKKLPTKRNRKQIATSKRKMTTQIQNQILKEGSKKGIRISVIKQNHVTRAVIDFNLLLFLLLYRLRETKKKFLL